MINLIYRILKLKTLTSRMFFWVIFLLCLSSLLYLLSFTYINKNEQMNKAKENIDYALKSQHQILNGWTTERTKEVKYLANLTTSQEFKLDEIQETFSNYIQYHDELSAVVILDEDGYVRFDSSSSDSDLNSNISLKDRDYFIAAKKGEDYISNIFTPKSTEEPVIIFSSPLTSDTNEFLGLVFGTAHLSKVNDVLSESVVSDSGEIIIINEEGIILSLVSEHKKSNYHKVGTKLDSEMTKLITSGGNLPTQYTNNEGEKVIGSFVPLANGDYYIINQINEREVFQSHKQMIPVQFIITSLIVLISIIFIIPIAKHLLNPLVYLINAIRKIKEGDYTARLNPEHFNSSPIEFQQSMEIFNEMSATIQRKESELQKLSSTDELTEIANRRELEAQLKREWRWAKRENKPLAVIFLDVDDFKAYNDAFGHQIGDICLRRIADAIKGSVSRARDLAARYGGEEFVILLPETNTENATLVAEQIRRNVEELKIVHTKSSLFKYVTVSLGVACSVPSETTGSNMLIERADLALYKAKSAGKNKVKVNT